MLTKLPNPIKQLISNIAAYQVVVILLSQTFPSRDCHGTVSCTYYPQRPDTLPASCRWWVWRGTAGSSASHGTCEQTVPHTAAAQCLSSHHHQPLQSWWGSGHGSYCCNWKIYIDISIILNKKSSIKEIKCYLNVNKVTKEFCKIQGLHLSIEIKPVLKLWHGWVIITNRNQSDVIFYLSNW